MTLIGASALASLLIPYILQKWDRTFLVPYYRISFHLSLTEALAAFPVILVMALSISFPTWKTKGRIGRCLPLALLFMIPVASTIPQMGLPQGHPDTALYFSQAKTVELKGGLNYLYSWKNRNVRKKDQKISLHFPLVPLIYGKAYTLFGESLLTTRLVSLLFFLFIPLVTLCLSRFFEAAAPLPAAFLTLTVPFLMIQNSIMHVDIPATLLFNLTILTGLLYMEEPGAIKAVLFSLLLILSLFTKITALLYIAPMIILYGYFRGGGRGYIDGKRHIIIIATAIVAGILLLLVKKPVLKVGGAYSKSAVSTFLHLTPFLFLLSIHSIIRGWRRWRGDLLVLIPSLLFPFLFVLTFCTYEHISRYLLPAIPHLAILSSMVFRGSGREETLFGLAIPILLSFLLLTSGYIPSLQNYQARNIQEAGEYLNTLPEEGDVLVVSSSKGGQYPPHLSIPFLDIYMKRELVYGGNIFHYKRKVRREEKGKWWFKERIHDFYLEREEKVYEFLVITLFAGGEVPDRERGLISSCYRPLKTFSLFGTSSFLFPYGVEVWKKRDGAPLSCMEMKFPLSQKESIKMEKNIKNLLDIF